MTLVQTAIECLPSCLSNYMDTEKINIYIPTLPYILPSSWDGMAILSVESPFCLQRQGDDLMITGPQHCCGSDAVLVLDSTDCTIAMFQSEIMNELSLTHPVRTIKVTDCKVVGWESDCAVDVISAHQMCIKCGCVTRGEWVGTAFINSDGSTYLPDGVWSVYIAAPPNLNNPKYRNVLELMKRRQQQYRDGHVTSTKISHGVESVSSTRKLVDYDSQIARQFERLKNSRRGVTVTRGSRHCMCHTRRQVRGYSMSRWGC